MNGVRQCTSQATVTGAVVATEVVAAVAVAVNRS